MGEEDKMYDLMNKDFSELTVWELHAILKARCDVFVVEQNCVCADIDGLDPTSRHIFIMTEDGRCAACLRIFRKPDEPTAARIGRVVTTERGKDLGRKILHEAVLEGARMEGIEELYIEAQTYAVGFYEKEGFRVCSGEFMEDGFPHVAMRLAIYNS